MIQCKVIPHGEVVLVYTDDLDLKIKLKDKECGVECVITPKEAYERGLINVWSFALTGICLLEYINGDDCKWASLMINGDRFFVEIPKEGEKSGHTEIR